jgi:hypothetical protein
VGLPQTRRQGGSGRHEGHYRSHREAVIAATLKAGAVPSPLRPRASHLAHWRAAKQLAELTREQGCTTLLPIAGGR